MSSVSPVPEATARDVAIIVIAGAIGGFLSVARALVQPEVWIVFGPHSWFQYVILPLMLGGLAGGVAVFVLTHFDGTNKLRMFFFAAICGLGFPQVIGSALTLVGGGAQAQEVLNRSGRDQAARLEALIDEGRATPGAVTKQVDSLLAIAPRLTSPAAKDAVNASLQRAIEVLPEIEGEGVAAEQLGSIAVNATDAGEYLIAAHAVAALDGIVSKSGDENVKDTALAARNEVREKLPQPMREAVTSLAAASVSAQAEKAPPSDAPTP